MVCFKEMGRRNFLFLVDFPAIRMLDTHLCVDVIQFQIGIKLLCIHFAQLGKCADLISSQLGI